MTLRDLIRDDALGTILNEDDLAEPITYYPGGHLYDPRKISALVGRRPPVVDGPDDAGSPRREITIKVGRDATGQRGVAAIEVGVDVVDCPEVEHGETPVRWRVIELLSHNAGRWTLRCAQ